MSKENQLQNIAKRSVYKMTTIGQLKQIRLWLAVIVLFLMLSWLGGKAEAFGPPTGTGPGGVGTNVGDSTLELWLQSDSGVFSDTGCSLAAVDAGGVGCWQDQSGNTIVATQTTAAQQPTYDASASLINGQPVIHFDAASNQVLNGGNINLGVFTVFAVFNATNAGIIYEHNDRFTNESGSNLFTSDICTTTVNRSNVSGDESAKTLAVDWATDGISRIVTQGFNGTDASHTISVDNALETLTTCNGASVDPGTSPLNAPVYIGDRAGGTTAPLTGNIAELIFFNQNLAAVDQILVENYLSSKYDIIMASNDLYDGDTTGNGDFDLNVAGIAQIGGSSNAVAHSAGMIVTDVSFLNDDGDSILFGHRTATNSNTIVDLPGDWIPPTAPDPQRWDRHWYIDVTDITTAVNCAVTTCLVDITFDLSEAGLGAPLPTGSTSNYRLLSRSGTSGNFADVTALSNATVSISGDQIQFVDVDVTILGSNFTVGTLDAGTSPTAVSLLGVGGGTSTFALPVMILAMVTAALTGRIVWRRKQD